jgi:transcriptional regulator with XRE-family HTH domain
MNETADPNAGEVLAILMERARVSPEQLAQKSQVTKTTVYNKLRGQAWKNQDSRRFAAAFGVPPEIFLKRPVDAMLWLIENDRFELEVIDLREVPSEGTTNSPCNADDRSRDLVTA